MSVSATITNISRGSLHDGPGVRTVFYFKGCALRCRWCHNPETLSAEKQIFFAPVKCVGCGKCLSVCPEHHFLRGGAHIYSRERCDACGKCARACPAGALAVCGEDRTVDELFDIGMKDAHFYRRSGGGITLSGGECLLRADFCAALLEKFHRAGVHTAVETALFAPWENVEKTLPHTDLFFADLKIADAETHRRYTGQDNALILQNLDRLSRAHHHIIVRTPVIPAVNDSPQALGAINDIIKQLGAGVKGVELLPYNRLAEAKYTGLGMTYETF